MKRKTAGELSLKAKSDKTKYDPLEIGYALCDDVINQLRICAQRHEKVFDEDEFCLLLVVAGDPLIEGLRRHKYAAFLYLPMPRPQQSVYYYNKKTQLIRRLWTMPHAEVMAKLSEMPYVAPQWQKTKGWCDAFYHGWQEDAPGHWVNTTPSHFFNYIRHQANIKMLSETEYLNAHREELIKSGCKIPDSSFSEPFDFGKVMMNKVSDAIEPVSYQNFFDSLV